MKRVILLMFAIGLCGTAAAADFVQASSIQQGTLQLGTDVTALRTSLTRTDISPLATLSTYAPALLERVRLVRSEASAYRQKIESQLESAEHKRQAAEAEYYIKNLEAAIQELGASIQQLSAAAKKLDEIAQKIEEIKPKLQALVGAACTLPHASTTIVRGACAIAACEKGWINADGNSANGCEAPLR